MIVLEVLKISFFRNKTTRVTLKTQFNLEMLLILPWLLLSLITIQWIRSMCLCLQKMLHQNKRNPQTFYSLSAMQKKKYLKIIILLIILSKEMAAHRKATARKIWWLQNQWATWVEPQEQIQQIVCSNIRKEASFQKIHLKLGQMTAL